LYNPVILKRFSEVWQAQEQLLLMNDFYTLLEEKLKLNLKSPILKNFSIEEQNNWFAASDKKALALFVSGLNLKQYPELIRLW
jgi:hypothetical protein